MTAYRVPFELVDAIFVDFQSGMNQRDLAAKYGRSQSRISALISKHPDAGSKRLPARPRVLVVDGVKPCSLCKKLKSADQFSRRPETASGLEPRCKACNNAENKKWRQANPAKQKYAGSWQQRNPEWRRKNLSNQYRSLKREAFFAYGGRCAQCGFGDERALHLDHVNENGAEERRRWTPLQVVKRIKSLGFPREYQLLCANCNTIKACEAGSLRYTKMREEAS